VLKPVQPLPFNQNEKLQLIVQRPAEAIPASTSKRQGYGLFKWTRSQADLDYLIDDAENDPLEGA
jgi:hypothetical protein